MLDHLQGVKPCFLVQLQFAEQSESVHLVNETGIFAYTYKATAFFKFVQGLHPDPIVLFPKGLVGRRPADKVRPLIRGIRLKYSSRTGWRYSLNAGFVCALSRSRDAS